MDSLAPRKRCFSKEQDGDCDSGIADQGERRRRRFRFASAVRDAMSEHRLKEWVQRMEPFFRKLVREQVEQASQRYLRAPLGPSSSQSESSGVRNWELHFVNDLPSTIFTGNRVEAEGSRQVGIVIRDAHSKDIIKSGPLSSIKIEILALAGDFAADDEDWTQNVFNTNIVRERDGRRPLVTGNLFVTLRSGFGYVDNVSFTDNSSWIRSRKFRLGARTVSGFSNDVRVREARSNAFVVKDHRGEHYKKNHPPSLGDEVWRLERIAKGGASHRRLNSNRIYNVKDFLRWYVTDESALRKMLGDGISSRIWAIIIEHANTCVGDGQLYVYYKPGERVGLVLNSIYKIVGLTWDGHSYQTADKLTMQEKLLMEDLKRHAYRNVNEIASFPATTPSPTTQTETSNNTCLYHLNFPATHQDQSGLQMTFDQAPFPLFGYDWDNNNQGVISPAPPEALSPILGNSFIMTEPCTGLLNGGFGGSNDTAAFFPVSATVGEDSSLFLAANREAEVNVLSSGTVLGFSISRGGKNRARWCKIRAALTWGISVRRDVATKRMGKHVFYPPRFGIDM